MLSSDLDNFFFEHMRGASQSEVADCFVKAWYSISHKTIVASWNIEEGNEDLDDESEILSDSDSDFDDFDASPLSDD